MVSDTDLAMISEKIILKPSIKQDLLGRIRAFNRADAAASRGLLLYGPPGTGKSLIGGHMGDLTGCHLMGLAARDLKAPYLTQSSGLVQKAWQRARAPGGCVMFIDECEWVFPRRDGKHSGMSSEELVQAFIAEWDRAGTPDQRVWVVCAADRKWLIDDAITSRFGAEIELFLPDAAERREILKLEVLEFGCSIEVPQFLAEETAGFSGRGLARLASDVFRRARVSGETITESLWRDAMQHRRPG
ncbi:MAG TPA: ATP-binding protein [Steroidobacteraceae bacterium]|jgi:SpoVK/Ycf46/Vps4 family AAA+-type ATPase|nr:ATP-binding protein [Steroidobacteraceae bacterium]